jgi:hypothetical protein
MDLSKLSDDDLSAIASGDMSKVSDKGLNYIVKQEEFEKELKAVKQDTGLTGSFKANKERLKGDIAALAGRAGIMDTDAAEQYKAQKEQLAERMFKPTSDSWSESPFLKFRETLGGSLPYTAAPLAAGAAALALPVSAPIAGVIGATGAGLASLGQFTGSNLSRQMQENPELKLAETNLGSAAAAAVPQAALDVVSLRMIPGIGKIFGAAGKEVTPAMAKQIAEQGMAKTLLSYGASGAKLSGVEGATEVGQQVMERLQAGLNITDEKARSEYFDSFIGGAVLGGTLSVPGTAIERSQTIRKGAEMEKEEQQKAIVERQNAQREAYLAEQAQIGKTKEALGVNGMLALPAPSTVYEAPVGVDPLLNPLGNFRSTDLSAKEVAEVNRRRVEAGLPRIGRTFSIEDLSNVFTPDEAKDQAGVLNRLIASRTGYQAGQDFNSKTVEFAAQKKGIDTGTQGFKDFLKRTTGLEDLRDMSPVQRLAVVQALQKVEPGEETQILQSGISNAKTFTEDQYNAVIKGLTKEFKEVGNVPNGRESVLKHIEKYSGLLNARDQKRMLDRLVKDDVLDHDMETREVNGVKKIVELFKPAQEMPGLPGGMDVRAETFKQGDMPAAYEIKAGAQVIDTVDNEEEANKNLEAHIQNRDAQVAALGRKIAKLEAGIASRADELVQMKSLGQGDSLEFLKKEGNTFGQDVEDRQEIQSLREQQQSFLAPVRMSPVGTKPITSEGFTYYENGKAIARFDSEEKADQFGISRLDDKTLQQIIDAAPQQTQIGKVKRYSDLAQKELNERQSIEPERGIAVTTTKGLKGAKERLEELGIYSKEAIDNLEKLRQTLLPALKRFGLEKVALRIINSIEDGKADGMYIQQVMTIALDSKNPMGTLRHESIHALKELGAFTPQEWKVLENKAKSEWVQKYIKDANLYESYKEQYKTDNGNLIGFEPYIQEEAIAEAFKAFKVGNLPPGMIGNIWMRLNRMFEALRNGFNKLGFQTTEDIFTKIDEGGIKTLEVTEPLEKSKFALRATQDERQDIINKAEQIAKTDQDTLDNTRWSDLPEGPFAYQYYEAQKLLPKPSDKLKKLNYRISEALDNHYEWLANVDGEYFGVTREEDPDYDPYGTKDDSFEEEGQAQKGKFNYVYSNLLDDLVSSELRRKSPEGKQTDHFDQKELFADMRKSLASEKTKYAFRTEKKDITPLSVQQARIYERELEDLIKKVGSRIAGMKSNETLDDVRKAVKKLQQFTAEGLQGKDWYERSAKAVLEAFNGDKVLAEKFFQIIAITSAGTEVGANFTKTLNAWNQFANNQPIKVGTGDTNKKIDALLNFGEDWGGRKTNTFYTNLMEAMEGTDTGRSTIDLHMTRLIFGKDAPTDAQYELAENMVRLLGSKVGLAPRQVQAASWVTQKAKGIFEDYRKRGLLKETSDEELRNVAFERAVADYSHQMKNKASKLPVTESLKEPSEKIRARTQNITGEVIPSVQTNMSQAEELAFASKEKLTKEIANAGTVQDIADSLGVTSKIRVTVGSGAYASTVNPNLIVQIVNDDAAVAEKDALDMANAMSYVFKQDATPLFRADPALLETDQLGFKLKFDTVTITPAQQKKMLAIFQDKFGKDAGFTRLRGNELVMINYRGEDGQPFLTTDEEFTQGLADITAALNEVSTIESQEFFGAKSEYNYYDWKEEPSGTSLVAGIQTSRPERPNIQRGLDDLRESFVDTVRTKVKESGQEPKFSLRSQIDPTIQGRIGATTTVRKEAGYVERIIDAISPSAMTKLRQAFINKYDSIEKLSRFRGEKIGGDELLAENSAIAAALQSDRAAGVAASSFRDGIPVFDKGYTYVTGKDSNGDDVKGLIPILEPLMKYNDPYAFQAFQYYAGTRRGRRLDAEGREKTFTKEDIEAGKQLEAQFPEFATVFDEYQKYNQGLVKYMMDTGVISADEAKIWTQNWDYIPFYRQLDGEKTAGPKVFSPIAGVAKPKKLKGSEAPLDDFMETIVRNARAAIEAGMKNEAARRVIRDVTDFGLGEKVKDGTTGSDIVTVKEKGNTVYYRVDDPLLVESLKGLNLPQLPFMDFLSAPANLLRNFVTKDPGFILANLGRDSMQAWITSGTDMKPLVDSFKQFGKELLNQSPEAYALARSGLTGYDFAGDVKSTAKQVEKELRKRSGTRTKREQALLPITAFWDTLEKGSHASDMATRAEVYKRTLERTGSEAEAFYQAMEVMNFSRKGNSALVRILSAMIPFFNARVQGLDVLYRTGFGKTAMENKEKIQKAFIFRSMVLLGSSVMYWAMVSDDEDYKKLSKEERDNYWIIPALRVGDKPFRFPIPFELGVLFKVLPERALEYSFGTDTGKDLRESLLRNAMSTLSFNPIPQAALPLVENATNHSFFTGEPIIGRGLEGLAPQYQFTAGTSELSKKLGKELDYSPQKIENLIRGYTGTMGTYGMMLIDAAITGEGDTVKAAKRVEQLPVIKRFFAGDSGTISAYYDLKEEVNTVVNTVNMLQRTGNADDLKLYLQDNQKLYALKGYIGVLDKSMTKLSQASKLIQSSPTMTADEKREALDKIHESRLKLTERVRILRKDFE